MDQRDIELIEKLIPNDPELKSLWEDHVLNRKQVDQLEAKTFRTPAEQQTLKQLKKQKLDGKTELMHALDQRRAEGKS